MYRAEEYLFRYEGNPILGPDQIPGAEAVMNGCPFQYQGQTWLLQPIIWKGKEAPSIHVCESEDGLHFTVRPEPFIEITSDENDPCFHIDRWLIDPRVTQIDDTYYIMRPGDSYLGTTAILGCTQDWKTYTHMDTVSLPMNRVPCLFPDKIGGRYARLDRPSGRIKGNIWISYSPDLIHWGEHRHLLNGWAHWQQKKIGPCVPIRTDKGWLVLIHGVQDSCAGSRYSLGAILLDLHNPEHILGKMNSWILTPDRDYEFQGNVPNVVFACAGIPDFEQDLLHVYYGAADTCMCRASGCLSQLVEACLSGA